MRLYLITHAHTQQDPHTDARSWRLSAEGDGQAAALSRLPMWRHVDRIVLSSEPKTRLTVQPLLESTSIPVVLDAHFDELLRPGWVGDYAERVRTALARPEKAAGDWEPASQALARFVEGVELLVRAYDGEALALVSHGLVLSLYRARLLGESTVAYADWQALSFGAAALVDARGERLLVDFEPVSGHMSRA